MSGPVRRPSVGRRKRRETSFGALDPNRPLKIGEAARVLGVEPYVLRFWETEFPWLKPTHTASKHRLYNAKDLELLQLIRRLLYEERFTIDGARRRLRELGYGGRSGAEKHAAKSHANAPEEVSRPPVDSAQVLAEIRRDLQSLYEMLKD